jgi:spore germination protein YaaH
MSRLRLAPLLAVLLVVGLCVPASGGSPDRSRAPEVERERDTPGAVTGFALGSAYDRLVRRNAHALTTLTVAGIGITPDGGGVAAPDRDLRRLLGTAHEEGLRAELLLSNYSNALEAFDPRAAARLLSSPARTDRVARRVAGFVRRQGWDGVNVDLERVRKADADGLVRLLRRLQELMPPKRTVSIDVSASTSLKAYRAHGYRLRAIGRTADVVVLMAYDMHGPTWSEPGPIGPLKWQRQAIAAARGAVPADRLDLGVAGYGYSWPRESTGRSLTVAAARRLVKTDGARAVWHEAYGEWSARLSNGTVLWWSDDRSWQLRTELAASRGLHGLALWRLGSADMLP